MLVKVHMLLLPLVQQDFEVKIFFRLKRVGIIIPGKGGCVTMATLTLHQKMVDRIFKQVRLIFRTVYIFRNVLQLDNLLFTCKMY